MKKILMVRPNNIGDLIYHLPAASVLKKKWPNCHITLLARGYTRPLLELCPQIDEILDWDSLQKKTNAELITTFKNANYDIALIYSVGRETTKRLTEILYKSKVKIRIGQGKSFYKWRYLNHRLPSRNKHPSMHVTQIGLELLKPLSCKTNYTLEQMPALIDIKPPALHTETASMLDAKRFQVVLHPFSLGHGKEWPLKRYVQLAKKLNPKHYQVFITGSKAEGERLLESGQLQDDHYHNLCGKLTLDQLAALLTQIDALVASSTGPLHLAAALGCHALGLFPNGPEKSPRYDLIKWQAIGKHAQSITSDVACDCQATDCACILGIDSQRVFDILDTWRQKKFRNEDETAQ